MNKPIKARDFFKTSPMFDSIEIIKAPDATPKTPAVAIDATVRYMELPDDSERDFWYRVDVAIQEMKDE